MLGPRAVGPVKGTSIVAIVYRSYIVVAMDTLCTDDTGEPFLFVAKMAVCPQFNGLVCGTGDMELIQRWFSFVQSSVLARDVGHISLYAPREMSKLAEQLTSERKGASPPATVLYHFGFSASGRPIAISFDSASGFAPKHYDSCVIVRPEIDAIPEPGSDIESVCKWAVDVMEIQRRQESSAGRQCSIGGDVIVAILNAHGCAINRVHRFEDYETHYERVLRRIDGQGPKRNDRRRSPRPHPRKRTATKSSKRTRRTR